MYEIVLGLRHTLVEHHLLHLCHINRTWHLATAQGCDQRFDVVSAITLLHIFRNQSLSTGEVCIEWELGIGRMATHTTALLEDLQYAVVRGQIFGRRTIQYAVGCSRCDCHYEHQSHK
jgi:hypothetical protein